MGLQLVDIKTQPTQRQKVPCDGQLVCIASVPFPPFLPSELPVCSQRFSLFFLKSGCYTKEINIETQSYSFGKLRLRVLVVSAPSDSTVSHLGSCETQVVAVVVSCELTHSILPSRRQIHHLFCHYSLSWGAQNVESPRLRALDRPVFHELIQSSFNNIQNWGHCHSVQRHVH